MINRGASLATIENYLIGALPRRDRLRLLALCEPVKLTVAEVLCESGKRTRHAYFPTAGFISLVTLIDGKPSLEVAMIGREGMFGAHLALGIVPAPLHALVQGPGVAWRIGVAAFRTELANSVALQRGLNRYLYVMMAQIATSVGCQRFHTIGPRVAHWILMSQDRTNSEPTCVTHKSLANILGVRRSSITTVAAAFQRSGLIAYRRGEVTVLDRNGLEAAACGCYAAGRDVYTRLLRLPSTSLKYPARPPRARAS